MRNYRLAAELLEQVSEGRGTNSSDGRNRAILRRLFKYAENVYDLREALQARRLTCAPRRHTIGARRGAFARGSAAGAWGCYFEIPPKMKRRQPMKAQLRTEPRPACSLCGSAGTVLYENLEDRQWQQAAGRWTLKRCANPACGLLWLDPRPIKEDIGLAYAEYVTHDPALCAPPASPLRRMLRAAKDNQSLRRLKSAAEHGYWALRYGYGRESAPRWTLALGGAVSWLPMRRHWLDDEVAYLSSHPGGRLLDVGCGEGRLLRRLAELGWRGEGVDTDPIAIQRAAASGVEAHCGALADQRYGEATFDAVTQRHAIEHVHDPIALLAECARILKPGGRLTLMTPNAESWAHAVFGEHYMALDPPRHLHLFTQRALENAVRRAGLAIRLSRTVVEGPWFCQRSYALSRGHSKITLRDALVGYFLALIHTMLTRLQPTRGECIIIVAEKHDDANGTTPAAAIP